VDILKIIEWINIIETEQLKRLRSRQSAPHGVIKGKPLIDHENPPIHSISKSFFATITHIHPGSGHIIQSHEGLMQIAFDLVRDRHNGHSSSRISLSNTAIPLIVKRIWVFQSSDLHIGAHG